MGVAIPQVLTEDRASGAQIIDGSLAIEGNKSQKLERTPSSVGNNRTWTFSTWVKKPKVNDGQDIIFNAGTGEAVRTQFYFNGDQLWFYHTESPEGTNSILVSGSSLFRDVSAWYHILLVCDIPNGYVKAYVNNRLEINKTNVNTSYITQVNLAHKHAIGNYSFAAYNNPFSASFSNTYLIDGQALTPSYFGYTDPLTNTWRPKKFSGTFTQSTTQYTGATALTWDDSPIGSKWTLSNSNKTAVSTASATYTGGNIWTTSINSNTTYAWTLDVTNGDSTGGWYFTDSQTATATHPDELGGNTLGLRGGETSAGTYGTFASANGTSSAQAQISLNSSVSPNGTKKIDFVVYRPASGTGKVWVKGNLDSTWIGGGDPSNTSSTASFIIPDGATYFAFIGYDTSSTTTLTLAGDGNIISSQGANSFYLPFDGNSPIGEDKSGQGNNWTPVNFGGSNTLEKATGALPILNTDGGGKVARVGVRTDSNASSLVLALPLVGIKSDFSNAVNSGTSNKVVTANGNVVGVTTTSNFYGGSYKFDGTGDYLTIPASSDFEFTGDFTIEWWQSWYKKTNYETIYDNNYVNGLLIQSAGSTTRTWYIYFNGGGYISETTEAPVGEWTHYALVRSGSDVKLYRNGTVSASGTNSATQGNSSVSVNIGHDSAGPYEFTGFVQDLRVYKGLAKYTQNFIPASTDPDILPDTPSGVAYSSNVALVPSTDGAVAFDGTNDYLEVADSVDFTFGSGDWTMECFVYPITPSSNSYQSLIMKYDGSSAAGSSWFWSLYSYTDGSSSMNFYFYSGSSQYSYTAASKVVRQKAWNHVVVTRDGNTVRLYVNGVQDGTIDVTGYTMNDSSTSVRFGTDGVGAYDMNGFISNARIIKGTCLYTGGTTFTPPSAPLTATENTKLLCCKSQTSATAADVTPGTITANGNAAATNFNPFTANINTQRGQESGYATLNPLVYRANDSGQTGSAPTFSNGNLTVSGGQGNDRIAANMSFKIGNSGKYYWEILWVGTPASSNGAGVRDYSAGTATQVLKFWYYSGDGTDGGPGATFTLGDTLGFALDTSSGNIDCYKNGVKVGSMNASSLTEVTPFISMDSGVLVNANFGQKPFKFPPPAGFQPLALANTPRPTIVRPDQYVGITTWTGDGAASRTISNLNMKPDFVWIKSRDAGWHALVDSVRGAGKILASNATNTEYNNTDSNNAFQAFTSNGFTVGQQAGWVVNDNTVNQVAWCWKAGGNSNTYNIDDVGYATTTAAGLTDGTLALTGASVNTKGGFSIISWTGASGVQSVPHGLGQDPAFIIVKSRTTVSNWYIYAKTLGADKFLKLDTTDSVFTSSTAWNNTSPSSTVISFNSTGTNPPDQNIIAYLWAEIPGFSKFGSYTGNGDADGPMIVTGFRPKWVMVKRYSTSGSSWMIYDATRNSYNVVNYSLQANDSAAELTYSDLDFTSNGFKIRTNNSWINASANFIYCAFAESPSFNLYGAQSNAR